MSYVKCKECQHEIEYKPQANFIIFCPKCLYRTHFECEYGYGPVAPCQIYLGTEEVGLVTREGNKYFLQTTYVAEKSKLETTYLDALEEASKIIQSKLKR